MDFASQTTTIGRYHVRFKNDEHRGHVVTFERLQDGSGLFYDPQTGFTNSESEWFRITVKDVRKDDCIDFYRVDYLDLNIDYCKASVKKKR